MNLVVTLSRQRSSVFMQACLALGLDVKYNPNAARVNPDGDFESWESQRGVNTSAAEYAPDTTLKVMIPSFLFRSQVGPSDKVILLLRAPAGVVKSQGDVGMGQPDPAVRRMNYWRLMVQMNQWLESHENPVLIVDTDDLMQKPAAWFRVLADFTGIGQDKVASAAALIQSERSAGPAQEPEDEAYAIYQTLRAKCNTNI
jgi:hypothetical protein